MPAQPLLHPRTAARLEAITSTTPTSFIFYGPSGSGKRLAADWLVAKLNCNGGGNDNCSVCRQVVAGNYPDYIVVAPEDKPSVTIDQVRRLLAALALAPYRASGVRLVVIDRAETLTTEAQNALLKSLEEPPSRTMFVLLTTAAEALLSTVRSRLAAVYFAPVAAAHIANLLEQSYGQRPVDAARLAELSDGVVGEAVTLATNADLAAARAGLDNVASQLLTADGFARLMAARKLADDKQPVAELLSRLQRHIVAGLISDGSQDAGRRQLMAVANARRLSAAGVLPRVVLDRLTLEL